MARDHLAHVYLDYNATTPIAPEVQAAMQPFLREHYGNPSSSHALGQVCREAIGSARAQVASLLGAEAGEIVFTGGGTESNNLAMKGILLSHLPDRSGHLVISAIEHPAITAPADFLQRLGFDVSVVGCDCRGVVDPEEIAAALRPDTRLVSIMHANNEVGTVQPIRQIADICHRREILVHTDAAQSVGKISTDVRELDVDLLSLAGHKTYAPKGVGALYVKRGLVLEPAIHGAGHERGMRPGTENVPYIVGLGRAAVLASDMMEETTERMAQLRDRLWKRLEDGAGSRLIVNGYGAERLPNTLSLRIANVSGMDLLARTPAVCASTGSACHSGSGGISATLEAMGLTPGEAAETIRLSVGWYTSEEEVDRAADLLLDALEACR